MFMLVSLCAPANKYYFQHMHPKLRNYIELLQRISNIRNQTAMILAHILYIARLVVLYYKYIVKSGNKLNRSISIS